MSTRPPLRACLAALVNALERRVADDLVSVDVTSLRVVVDSRLDDVDARPSPSGRAVLPPDGLFEWAARRDFVRSLPAGPDKRRLGKTLGGPKTRRRFEVALSTTCSEDLRRAFVRFRRARLVAYAARVLRFHLARLDGAREPAPAAPRAPERSATSSGDAAGA